jgi:hypothetical protein
MVIALVAAAGLQIVAMNFMARGVNYIELLKTADFSALAAAFNMMPFLF